MFSSQNVLGDSTNQRFLLVYCLSLALAVSIIVILALAYFMYKLKKKSCTVCKGRTFRIKALKHC